MAETIYIPKYKFSQLKTETKVGDVVQVHINMDTDRDSAFVIYNDKFYVGDTHPEIVAWINRDKKEDRIIDWRMPRFTVDNKQNYKFGAGFLFKPDIAIIEYLTLQNYEPEDLISFLKEEGYEYIFNRNLLNADENMLTRIL